MIAILGATGKLGGSAARALRARSLAVRAIVRDPASVAATRLVALGCTIARADLDDAPTVAAALAGAERVLAICPLRGDADDVLAAAARTVDTIAAALVATRPAHVVAISDYGAQHATGTGITLAFRRLEDVLGALPIATTFVRSAEHMQNTARQARVITARGIVPSLYASITTRFPTVSAHDVGAIAAELLAAPAPARTHVLHVEGPQRVTATEIAVAAAALFGRPVVAHAVPRDQWATALAAAGLRPDYARLVCELQDAHAAGRIDVEAGGEVRLGTTDLATALAPYLAAPPSTS